MRAIGRGLAGVTAVAALAACGGTGVDSPAGGQQAGLPPPVTGTPAVRAGWTSCAVDAPTEFGDASWAALTLPRLGTDFVPTAAIHCQLEPKQRAKGGVDLVLTESRATELTALLAALRLSDTPPTTDACNLDAPPVPNLLLLDGEGRWIRPGLPVDGCGKPLPEVLEAVRGLRLTTVTEKVVRELESAEASASGCGQESSDVVATETGDPASLARPGRVAISFPSTVPLRLCVFRVPVKQQGTPQPAGTFEYGLVLPQQRRESVERALTALPPAKKCTGAADRFAVLWATDRTGGEVYVELDHCRRVLTRPMSGPPILAQADTTLVGLLRRKS
ncbi:hypothetical protein GA0074692_1300 [Micromonospora pallida]|uniref:Uncharacterized protein n=1 Tax=Micromonospora pallida TaxID=145854 RepID=A0A1C6RXP2_9ACTN|nr:hypothetical protein [Micromonospora pallida]SCL21978.1 hypothetical protein GA0074692_1300 [Micromonospora pallida]